VKYLNLAISREKNSSKASPVTGNISSATLTQACLQHLLSFGQINGDKMDSKVCVVTGSSSGIGRAIAIAGTRCQAGSKHEGMNGHTPESSENHRPTDEAICRAYGVGKALFVQTDVTSSEQVKNLTAKALEAGGPLDVSVHPG
ncbi:2-(R)-hydroxypropyl-CoM dehydrogenase, partial [Penicillium angulare]|uniref:2-(R)-hydroxypropyl-CoM dehydrogenase n=1 Tax=Penicillium angulare TaxID=116970 RepID=UPI002540F9BA